MRSVPEWIGRNDDAPVPPRVRVRVFRRHGERCAGPCGRALREGDAWSCDHVVAICNGGQNRESNLQPLCDWCRPAKDALDVATKSIIAKAALRHCGIKLRPKGRPMLGTRASGWRKRLSGKVEPW
jgi:hypothetical protein